MSCRYCVVIDVVVVLADGDMEGRKGAFYAHFENRVIVLECLSTSWAHFLGLPVVTDCFSIRHAPLTSSLTEFFWSRPHGERITGRCHSIPLFSSATEP
jgi:hypothetical protein